MLDATAIRRYLGSTDPTPSTRFILTPALWLAFLSLALALSGDVLTTGIFVASGNGHEGNPLAALLLHGGLLPLAAFKLFSLLVVYGLCVLLVIDGTPSYLFWFSFFLYFLAAALIVVCISNLMAAFLGDDLFHFLLNLYLYH